MRIIPFLISLSLTALMIIALNFKWGPLPPLGKFLSPQQGFWQNAESVDGSLNEQLNLPQLRTNANVYLDNRLVPHIFANDNNDAYFIQGYLHAKYRLWQMEFQVLASSGRVSELLGNDPRFLKYDREQRRLGMVYAAERTEALMNSDAAYKSYFDAYTNGVNAYISSLTESNLPIEYKLLDYHPEPWSNLKIALFLKTMAKELAGYDNDLEFTNAKTVFNPDEINILYPQISDSSMPIIPKGTVFGNPGMVPVKPLSADSAYFNHDTLIHATETGKPNPNNGSNNWALAGMKTKSGAPILCNDPHLNLTLPSIWYEMQMHTPDMNVYGATFPGAPSIIIGFNDSIAFGFTNAQRDVKDYYTIKFKDDSRKEYWYNGNWVPAQQRIETIKVKGASTFYDTVSYTAFGPVMYDRSFDNENQPGQALAVRWAAHDSSNEASMFFKLDRARNYTDYLAAIKDLHCPGQNMLMASKGGDIALWQQGKFPARWWGQGMYVMPGNDSSYQWQGFIPQEENPHVLNPAEGFIESANQRPVDASYPYFIPGNYIAARGITLSKKLSAIQNASIDDMKALQNDYFSQTASLAVPVLKKYIYDSLLDGASKKYLQEISAWDYMALPQSRAMTIFQAWMDSFKISIWADEFSQIKGKAPAYPDNETLLEAIIRDSAFRFIDNIHSPQKENINDQVTSAFIKASKALEKEEGVNGLIWWKHKHATIYHLLRNSVMPFAHQDLEVGGSGNSINAITDTHGPSWRMIVQLSEPIEAYGIYPGGQSGNPGSIYYDNFIDDWTKGQYFRLWVMKETEVGDNHIIGKLSFRHV